MLYGLIPVATWSLVAPCRLPLVSATTTVARGRSACQPTHHSPCLGRPLLGRATVTSPWRCSGSLFPSSQEDTDAGHQVLGRSAGQVHRSAWAAGGGRRASLRGRAEHTAYRDFPIHHPTQRTPLGRHQRHGDAVSGSTRRGGSGHQQCLRLEHGADGGELRVQQHPGQLPTYSGRSFCPGDTGGWSGCLHSAAGHPSQQPSLHCHPCLQWWSLGSLALTGSRVEDRKSTRLNSSHVEISYAVFCLKKK